MTHTVATYVNPLTDPPPSTLRQVSKMQAEAERKDAYFVHVAEGVDRRALEDKHMVRFGPEVTRDTLLVMVGPIKAAELRANNAEVAWLTHVASALNEMFVSQTLSPMAANPQILHPCIPKIATKICKPKARKMRSRKPKSLNHEAQKLQSLCPVPCALCPFPVGTLDSRS